MSAPSDYIAATFGVSMAQAHDFIMAHVSDPAYIYNMAVQYHVSSGMLGEITGYSSTDVEGFFSAHGMDGMALQGSTGTGGSSPGTTTTGTPLLSLNGSTFPSSIVAMDNFQGALSTASMHAAVVAVTGQAAYDAVFNPAQYDTNHDGVFSASELGSSVFGTLPATEGSLESVFYGTLITALKSIDATEMANMSAFAQANATQLQAGDTATVQQLVTMMLADISTPASTPALSDSMIAQAAVGGTAQMVELVGSGAGSSLFQALIST